MKNLFLSSALSITSLVIPPVFAGPGESASGNLKNTPNDCNTTSGSCPITPTKFSTKIYSARNVGKVLISSKQKPPDPFWCHFKQFHGLENRTKW